MPSKLVPSTPYELWNGRKPSLKHLKIWGCPAYVKNTFGHKLGIRLDKYLFVGYPKKTRGYYFYHLTKQKIIVSRHVIFLKKEFIQEGGSGKNIELKEVQDLQSVLELPMKVSQPEVPSNMVHPKFTPPL